MTSPLFRSCLAILFVAHHGVLCLADPIVPEMTAHLNEPRPTTVLVRVVAHGSMVLGKEVGGARVTITDVATGRLLATGLQQGEAGDQNQIMRTPRLLEEPIYSTKSSASFTTTLDLLHPTQVDITAEGPLAYPAAMQRVSKRLWLIPGQDMIGDGIVLTLYGYIVQIEQPKPNEPLVAREDLTLRASIRTLSGSWVRPHGDWDSRKLEIYGEILIGDRVIERLQLFYSGRNAEFEAPFFVPRHTDAPDGMTLRVIAADRSGGNFGVGLAKYPVLSERLTTNTR
ncbi:hypothetical protein [Candidatus Nitrospira inopinata]|jgi:hypothetical protein|uniref:Uncharacterized protein n=1 Tax=Candidatus Nitrospira inopinata TaxID=1715989 RepID=A0A0S4KTG5_9BACT|nr:hypothetical protein [Candidatus Nitrospira inopinata]CUQ67333.1 conserved exported protein of unknown function [Candidatus Nitrospira inopinata]